MIMEKPDEPSENIFFLVSTSLHVSVPAQWEEWGLDFKVISNANHSWILWYYHYNPFLMAKSESQILLDDLTAIQALLVAAQILSEHYQPPSFPTKLGVDGVVVCPQYCSLNVGW